MVVWFNVENGENSDDDYDSADEIESSIAQFQKISEEVNLNIDVEDEAPINSKANSGSKKKKQKTRHWEKKNLKVFEDYSTNFNDPIPTVSQTITTSGLSPTQLFKQFFDL